MNLTRHSFAVTVKELCLASLEIQSDRAMTAE